MLVSPTPHKAFTAFDAYEPTLVRARDESVRFVTAIKANPFDQGYCLTLCGKSGTGKTMLAEIVLSELRLNKWCACDAIRVDLVRGHVRRFDARFYNMRKVSDGFKNGQWGIVEEMEDRRLAVLDDVGAEHDPSRVTASKVDRVLRSRKGRWTIVTINLPLHEIADKLDARIASFIIRDDNRFVEIQVGDYAMRKFKK